MPELFTYLLKINIALVLFCLGYYAVLRKLTFYTLNRAYLVTAIIFSSIYPFIDLSVFAQRHQDIVAPVQNVVIIWQAPAQNLIQQASYWNWLEVLFWTGTVVLSARLLFQLTSLYKIYRDSTEHNINGQTVRVVKGDISPFSFWRSIYLNPEKLAPADLHNVVEHERVHVSEWHTLDVLLTEISVIFYWFNPGIWMIKKAVRENIEFITDRKILQKGLDSKAYQYSLLSITFNQPAPAITSNFNFSTLKKRIMMMNAKRSSNLNLTRYAFLMPVVVICLLAFSLSNAGVVKASPAFKAVAATVKNIKELTFGADTAGKKTAKASAATKINASILKQVAAMQSSLDAAVENAKITFKTVTNDTTPRIKSGGFINDSTLVIFDGKPVPNLNNVDPHVIETVTVLKSGFNEYIKTLPEIVIPANVNVLRLILVTTRTSGRSLVDIRPGFDNLDIRSKIRTVTADSAATVSLISRINGRPNAGPYPLVIIDGKEMPTDNPSALIKNVDLNTIESINILKDGNSASIYGEKAKNGVIIVTTKKK